MIYSVEYYADGYLWNVAILLSQEPEMRIKGQDK